MVKKVIEEKSEFVAEMHKKHAYPDKDDIVINTEKCSVRETVNKIMRELR